MAQPLINGVSYHWAQIELNLFNTPVMGVTSIEYSDEQEMQDNYGAGVYPVSRSYGKIKSSAKLTLEMAELVALQAATPTGRIQDIAEFDIVISYSNGVNIVTDTIKNCRFMQNSRSSKSGSADAITVDVSLMVSHIVWNQ